MEVGTLNDMKKYEDGGELKQLLVSSQQMFPAAPFPRKYVHCVMHDLTSIVQTVHALWADGYSDSDTHVMACWDYVEAVERKHLQSPLSALLIRILSFTDDGFSDTYLREVARGKHFLAVRLVRNDQMHRVCDLLMVHNAHVIKYVDTWTVTDLVPPLAGVF